jgi:long-chain acyl-CoA synthetase
MKYKNLGDMFFSDKNPDDLAFKHKKDGEWISVSFKEAFEKVEQLAVALLSLGIQKGDKVAIMSSNSVEWSYTDYAVVSIGAVLVPIYPTLMSEQAKYILNNSESKIVIASDAGQAEKIEEVKDKLDFTKDFYLIDFEDYEKSKQWQKFNSFFEKGGAVLQNKPTIVSDIINNVEPETVATIIYTSGTTGEPKGSMLTHSNFLSNIESAAQVFKFYKEDDIVLSFLPLCHVLERMAGHYQSMYHGVPVAYAESIDQVPQNLLEIQPTLFISVPRLYEKIYAKVIENVELGSFLKRKIFYWAIKTGKKYIRKIMYHEEIPGMLKFKRDLAFKLVFKKISDKLGGRIRFMVSGGAPLSAEIGEFFGAAGLYILEGYGLTETSPAIAINQLDKFRYGTVGPVLPEVEVKIAEDGEILSRGKHIMKGYFKNESETREVIDSEGWFHTGDIGHLDDDGFLVITDRKKNIIVTSGGKNIAPQPIENLMVSNKYIEQVLVIGDKKNYCTAVIVAAKEQLIQWLNDNKIELSDYNIINENEKVRELYRNEIDKHSVSLARFETIKDFYLTSEVFTIENDMLTPTLKVKRKIVEEKYKSEIDRMYET